MLSQKLLSSIIDESLTLSNCSPYVTGLMREVFISHYATHTLFVSDNYPEIINVLYGMNDQKMYSIVSLSFVDEYMFFLLPLDQVSPRDAIREIISEVKQHTNFSNLELGKLIKNIHEVKFMLQMVFDSSIRTSRKAVGNNIVVSEPVLPPIEEMKRFYECERKTIYSSTEDATQKLSGVNEVYTCPHCGKLHQGQKPTGMAVPQNVMEGRYRTAWRRYHGI
jgi:hypothetical protein